MKIDMLEKPSDILVHDARSVANFFLDCADKRGQPITHVSLQKILFFAQGWHYAYYGTPLIKNTFEAWEYGPVIRCVYKNFKKWGDQPIQSRAECLDVIKNQKYIANYNFISRQRVFLEAILFEYGPLNAFHLVDLTHTVGSPWYKIWNHSKAENPIGLDIPNCLIEKYFKSLLGNKHLKN